MYLENYNILENQIAFRVALLTLTSGVGSR